MNRPPSPPAPKPYFGTLVRHYREVVFSFATVHTAFLLGCAGFGLVAFVIFFIIRQLWLRRILANSFCVAVSLPQEIGRDSALRFWQIIAQFAHPKWKRIFIGQSRVSFEYQWSGETARIQIWCRGDVAESQLRSAIFGAWPQAQVESVTDELNALVNCEGGVLDTAVGYWLPIGTQNVIDPIDALDAGVGHLDANESSIVQVICAPLSAKSNARGFRYLASKKKLVHSSDVTVSNSPEDSATLAKLNDQLWSVTIRYLVGGDNTYRLKTRAAQLASAFGVFTGHNSLRRRRDRRLAIRAHRRLDHHSIVLSSAELQNLAHLAYDDSLIRFERSGAALTSANSSVAHQGVVLGVDALRRSRRIAIDVEDMRFHTHVLGATGTGKSTLLSQMIRQDIAAKRCAIVVDPKGDLARDVFDSLSEHDRARAIVIDPTKPHLLPRINLLEGPDKHLVVDHVVGTMARMFRANWGPRTDDVLRVACLSLLADRNMKHSFGDITTLLLDEDFRSNIADKTREDAPQLWTFWRWYGHLSFNEQANLVGPVLNKLRAFLLRDFVAQLLNVPESSFSFGDVLNSGGIVLIRIPKGEVGDETSSLLGSLLVSHIWQVALRRVSASNDNRRDAHLYIDECHNFLHLPGDIGDILAEARGLRLGLVLAHQHLGQLPSDLSAAIDANARNKIYFTASSRDANILAKSLDPVVSAHDLANLPRYVAVARLMSGGTETPPCSIATELEQIRSVEGDLA